jgi:hypothetical protein
LVIAPAPSWAAESLSRSELESVSPGDPQFRWAVEELMKLHYKDQNWPSFFSYAQYYRSSFSSSGLSKVSILEGLALLRHCQNHLLEQLLLEWRGQAWFSESLQKQLGSLSRTRFKGKEARKASDKGSLYWRGASLKRSNTRELNKSHPKNFYLKLESQCED